MSIAFRFATALNEWRIMELGDQKGDIIRLPPGSELYSDIEWAKLRDAQLGDRATVRDKALVQSLADARRKSFVDRRGEAETRIRPSA